MKICGNCLNEAVAKVANSDTERCLYCGQTTSTRTYGKTIVADSEDELYEKIVGRPKGE